MFNLCPATISAQRSFIGSPHHITEQWNATNFISSNGDSAVTDATIQKNRWNAMNKKARWQRAFIYIDL